MSRDFSARYMRGDAAGMAAIYKDDAVIFPPGRAAIRDRPSLEAYWRLAEGERILPHSLPERLWSTPAPAAAGAPLAPTRPSPDGNLSLKQAIRELEESYIRAALRRTRGNRTRAAEVLEISHRALLYKIKEYGIDADAEGERG